MNFGDIRGSLDKMIQLLKEIGRNTNQSACCTAVTSAGTGVGVPIGVKSIAIVKTDSGAGLVNIQLSDGSIFALSLQGESFVDVSADRFSLPAYVISSTGGATWSWHGIK